MPTPQRVVITGLGAITPIGLNVGDYWDALVAGVSGTRTIESFDVSKFSTQFAAQVRGFDPETVMDKKEARRTSRFITLAIAAACEAVADSGLIIDPIANEVGVELGSGIGGIEILEDTAITLANKGPSRISPFTVPMMISDMAAGLVSIRFGAKGPNACAVTACASAATAMGNAFRIIRNGEAIAMITGGSEAAITPLGLGSFCAARSLSGRNESPETASRPFDLNRDGFVMGEGSGILIFESRDHAIARGAKIYAEVIGYGASADAHHITAPAPHGEGAARAMTAALRFAGIQPDSVDYINAHGTSTELNDACETDAIKSVFQAVASQLAISSTKSMTGHLLGAAAAIELIACAKVVGSGIIPPTINYETPDPRCDLPITPNHAISKPVDIAMSNSFGFGGHNAVLIIRKYS